MANHIKWFNYANLRRVFKAETETETETETVSTKGSKWKRHDESRIMKTNKTQCRSANKRYIVCCRDAHRCRVWVLFMYANDVYICLINDES